MPSFRRLSEETLEIYSRAEQDGTITPRQARALAAHRLLTPIVETLRAAYIEQQEEIAVTSVKKLEIPEGWRIANTQHGPSLVRHLDADADKIFLVMYPLAVFGEENAMRLAQSFDETVAADRELTSEYQRARARLWEDHNRLTAELKLNKEG